MEVLVTGATGFIGNHLCRLLSEQGFSVVALVRPGSDIYKLRQLKNIRFIYGDIQVYDGLKTLQQFPETVFHLAANWDNLDVEIDRRFLSFLIESGLKKVIFYSSVCAAGLDLAKFPLKESDQPVFLENDGYGKYKYAAEQLITSLITDKKIEGVILRPTLVYGPGDTNNISNLVKAVRLNKLAIWDNGKRVIAPCSVKNLNNIAILAATTNTFTDIVYNVADGEELNTLYVTKVIAEKMGFKHRYSNWSSSMGYRKGFIIFILNKLKFTNSSATHFAFKTWTRSYDVDLKRLQSAMGTTKLLAFEDGMEETLKWYKNENII